MDLNNSKYIAQIASSQQLEAMSDPDAELNSLTNYPYIGFSFGNSGRESKIHQFFNGFFKYCDGIYMPQLLNEYIDENDCGVNSPGEQLARFLQTYEDDFEFVCRETGNMHKPAYIIFHKSLTTYLRKNMDFDNTGDYTLTANNLRTIADAVDELETLLKRSLSEETFELLKLQRYISVAMIKHL